MYFEAMSFICLNAVFLGVLYARISSASRRACSIVFSNTACIRCIRNRFYLMFQVKGRRPRPWCGEVKDARARAHACGEEGVLCGSPSSRGAISR